MRVFNLTDVPTPALQQKGFVSHTFAVGPALLGPGESAEVAPEHVQHIKRGLQRLIADGALAMNQPPPSYLVAKDRAKSAKK